MTDKIPRGWLVLVSALHTTIERDFSRVTVTEMTADRGWLHVRVDDRALDPATRLKLDRVVQSYVTTSLSTCMCCGSGSGRDRGDRRVVTCDSCEEVSCNA